MSNERSVVPIGRQTSAGSRNILAPVDIVARDRPGLVSCICGRIGVSTYSAQAA